MVVETDSFGRGPSPYTLEAPVVRFADPSNGDSIQDAGAARSTGIPFVGIRTWVYSEEDLEEEGALAVFNDLMNAAIFTCSFNRCL